MTFEDKLDRFVRTVQDQRKDYIECHYHILTRDYASARAVSGRKYVKVDICNGGSWSGKYMVEISTGIIYGIKGYGKIHKGHSYGTVDTIDKFYWGDYDAVLRENMR